MAKADWVVVNPLYGSGNKTVNVSSSAEHTGRNVRSSSITITAVNCDPCQVAINQAGKPEFVQNDSDTASCAKEGATVTISGKSNSSKLTFSIGSNNTLGLEAPTTYLANSLMTNNGVAIQGDPGASAEYVWSVQFVVVVNETIEEKTAQIIVTDNAGNSDTCILTQAVGNATLSVNKEVLELTYQGTAVSFEVKSNTSWTIV